MQCGYYKEKAKKTAKRIKEHMEIQAKAYTYHNSELIFCFKKSALIYKA